MAAVTSIDHRTIGNGKPGPVTEKIGSLFARVLLGEEAGYEHWVSPVYA